MADRTPPLGVEELHALVAAGDIDTVVLAFPDMQGRLQGKRFAARFFLDEVLEHGTEGCNYLLAVDADMNTVDGYAMSSWDRGYGDFAMRADPATLRRLPWNEGTAMAVADLAWEDGSPVLAAPRQILRRQLERLAGHGYTAQVGTELEFIVFRDTYEHAWDANYRGLTPANQYNVDYSVLGTGRVEPLLRRIRNEMAGAGLTVESAKGECNPGQHEIAFRYDEALVTCDQHAVYKTGAKEIAAQEGMSLTFMAKYNELEGNSCHIHLSLADADGRNAMAEGGGMSDVMRHFLAGQLVALREFSSSTPRTSTPTSASSPVPSPPPPSPGATTTAPAPCASSATAAPSVSRTGSPAATSTPTSRWPAWSRPDCTASSSGWNCPSPAPATRTPPTSRTSPPPCARPPSCGRTAPWPRPPSGTRSSPTTGTWPASNWTPSTPPSPTGNCAAPSNACEAPVVRAVRAV